LGGYEWVHGLLAREWATPAPLRALRRRRQAEPPPYERAVRDRALEAYGEHRGARRRYEAALLASLRTYLPHLLNRQDKNTMQRSVETRVPFLDPSVARFALNLPLELRVEPERKTLLRELGARVLPPGIAERPKIGFGFDTDRYLGAARPDFLGDGALREALEVAREDWGPRVAELRGQPRMLATTAEILLRGLIGGESPETIDRALWG
jgi:asparagine synthetase B (glutamine-hydrolysing)